MSWRVQALLLNSELIRTQSDIDSDDFNDLLVLEAKIKELFGAKVITAYELNMINLVQTTNSIEDVGKKLNRSRFSVAKDFVKLCNRLAFTLGNGFTDDGYIEEIIRRYRLDEEDSLLLRGFIQSKVRPKKETINEK